MLKRFVREDGSDAADALIDPAIRRNERLVAPAWAWAEVGHALRRRSRRGELAPHRAAALWAAFLELPIDHVDSPALRERAWTLADEFSLASLYDATFLACAELTGAEFWTADLALVRQLGAARPAYVHELGARSP